MSDFSTLTLSRVICGIISLHLSEPLHKLRRKVRQEWGDFEATGEDDLGLVDYLHCLTSRKYPSKAAGPLFDICEKAFGEGLARQYGVRLKVWAFMQDDSERQGLPFSEDDCLRFVCAFFKLSMGEKDAGRIGPAAVAVMQEVQNESVPQRWHLTYLRNRMLSYVELKEFERKYSRVCKACRTHGATNEDTYRLFQETIVRIALQAAAGSHPPSGTQTGASA